MQVRLLFTVHVRPMVLLLIETKKGSGINGKPKFELRTSYGVVSELKPLKVYDAQGYMQHLYDFLTDNGTNITLEQTPNYLQVGEKANYDATPDHAAYFSRSLQFV